MSRNLELSVDRVVDVTSQTARDLTAAPLRPFEAGAWECTCLVIGAEGQLARRIVEDFPRFGVRPVLVNGRESTVRMLRTWSFDSALIDAPDPDRARQILLRVGADLLGTPVVLLSGSPQEQDMIVALERGATDVLPQEASTRLIATKLKRLSHIAFESCRRTIGSSMPTVVHLGRLRLDLRDGRAWVDNAALDLPGRTFAVLTVLAQHLDKVIDRTTLSLHLGADTALSSRSFDQQISKLRAALRLAGAVEVVIDTVYRRGYRLSLRSPASPPAD